MAGWPLARAHMKASMPYSSRQAIAQCSCHLSCLEHACEGLIAVMQVGQLNIDLHAKGLVEYKPGKPGVGSSNGDLLEG